MIRATNINYYAINVYIDYLLDKYSKSNYKIIKRKLKENQ